MFPGAWLCCLPDSSYRAALIGRSPFRNSQVHATQCGPTAKEPQYPLKSILSGKFVTFPTARQTGSSKDPRPRSGILFFTSIFAPTDPESASSVFMKHGQIGMAVWSFLFVGTVSSPQMRHSSNTRFRNAKSLRSFGKRGSLARLSLHFARRASGLAIRVLRGCE